MREFISRLQKIDTHVHLGDICGVGHPSKINTKQSKKNLLVQSDYNHWLCKFISSNFFPSSILKQAIAQLSHTNTISNLVESMKKNNISKVWLLPIEPFVSSYSLAKLLPQDCVNSFVIFASVNFLKDSTRLDIHRSLNEQKSKLGCPGIKFHPNIQNVDPTSPKAIALYEAAEELDMFIVMHGGITPFLRGPQKKLGRVRKALDIFRSFKKAKVILAHMGQYFEHDRDLFFTIKNKNVYLDTSGVSSGTIHAALQCFDVNRIIFGSDWPFSRQSDALSILLKAVISYTNSIEKQREIIEKILSRNAKIFQAAVN